VTDFLLQYGLFLAKTITFAAAVIIVLAGLFSLIREAREQSHDHLQIKNINDRFELMADTLNDQILDENELKQQQKTRKAEEKAKQKAAKKGQQSPRSRLFSLSFDGDINATPVDSLREEISAILQVARKEDEILLRLESEGGLVHSYGLAASQLTRIRDRKIKLTVVVDKVAASGGYLMACVADKILAAPFAIIGSIGVVAQIPNFHRILKKNEIDFELHTAGQYKRTLTLFGENTDEGREKFREELEETHQLFKAFVTDNRPVLDIEKVATGEHWYGTRALSLRLIDEIKTSDDYLLERAKDADIYEIAYRRRQTLSDRLSGGLVKLGLGLRGGVEKAWLRKV
jgi:serine protease SohB